MLAGPTAPPGASCSEHSNLAASRPPSALPLQPPKQRELPTTARKPHKNHKQNPQHNSAKKREKVGPIIHILKGNGFCLKISCECPPRLKIAPQGTGPVRAGSGMAFFPSAAEHLGAGSRAQGLPALPSNCHTPTSPPSGTQDPAPGPVGFLQSSKRGHDSRGFRAKAWSTRASGRGHRLASWRFRPGRGGRGTAMVPMGSREAEPLAATTPLTGQTPCRRAHRRKGKDSLQSVG